MHDHDRSRTFLLPIFVIIITALLCLSPTPAVAASQAARSQGGLPDSAAKQFSGNIKTLAPGPPGHLFGDWGGSRKTLHNLGINIGLSYLAQLAGNPTGGMRQGVSYVGQVEAKFGFDFGKLAGLHGLSLHVNLINRQGNDLGPEWTGDHLLLSQQVVPAAAGDVLVHLSYAYLEQKLWGNALVLKAGRMAMVDDFGNLPDGCDFMALAICAMRPLNINTDWTAFPHATWGGNVTVNTIHDISLKIGAYEVNPRHGMPSGFYWSLNGAKGVNIPFELDWQPKLGAAGLPGLYKIGGYVDTATFDNWYSAVNGMPLPLTSLPARQTNRTGFYILAQQMLWQHGPKPGDGLTMLAGYVHNSPDNAVFQHFAFIGLLDRGPFPGRPDDRAGLSFVHLRVSPDLTSVQELQSALGQPLSNQASGIQTTEMLLEANYNFVPRPGIGIMPDLQWVMRPDATSRYPNALVLGLQVWVKF